VNNSDERDHAEEQANRAEMQEQDHCIPGVDEDGYQTSCTDDEGGGDCVCCPCCCQCLGCEYGPRDGLGLTDEQRAGARAIAESSTT
jgi:hypothetical protein